MADTEGKIGVFINLTPGQAAEVDRLARDNGHTRSGEVRHAVLQYLNYHRRKGSLRPPPRVAGD